MLAERRSILLYVDLAPDPQFGAIQRVWQDQLP